MKDCSRYSTSIGAMMTKGKAEALLRGPELGQVKRLVEAGGGRFVGLQENPAGPIVVMFDDPATKSTLCLLLPDLSVGNVRARIARSRAQYAGRK